MRGQRQFGPAADGASGQGRHHRDRQSLQPAADRSKLGALARSIQFAQVHPDREHPVRPGEHDAARAVVALQRGFDPGKRGGERMARGGIERNPSRWEWPTPSAYPRGARWFTGTDVFCTGEPRLGNFPRSTGLPLVQFVGSSRWLAAINLQIATATGTGSPCGRGENSARCDGWLRLFQSSGVAGGTDQ